MVDNIDWGSDEDWDDPDPGRKRRPVQKRKKPETGWDIPKDVNRSIRNSAKDVIARLAKAESAVTCCHRNNIKRKSCPCGAPIRFVACKTCSKVICSDQCFGLRIDDLPTETEVHTDAEQHDVTCNNEQPTSSPKMINRSISTDSKTKDAKTLQIVDADVKNPFGSLEVPEAIEDFDWRSFYIDVEDSDPDDGAEGLDEYLTCVKIHSEGFTRSRQLEDYIGENVKIMHMSNPNRAYIIPVDVYDTFLLGVMDEVNDVCMNGKESSEDLQPGSLACVWIDEHSEVMFRCLILGTNELIRKARVYLLDFGKIHYYDYEYIRPFSEDLLELDLLGFETKIKGFPAKINSLTASGFADFQFFMYKQELKLTSVEKNIDGYYEVELEDAIGNITRHLPNYLIWEWKKYIKEKGPSDDETVITGLQQHDDVLPENWEESLFWNGPISMKCSGMNKKNATAEFCEIQNSQISRDFRILRKQIMGYFRSVRSSLYFPNKNALCMASKAGGEWRRAVRIEVSNDLYCFDTGDRIENLTSTDVEIRRVPNEFFRVPVGRIVCKLEGVDSANISEKLEVGKFYDVQITSLSASDVYLGLLIEPEP